MSSTTFPNGQTLTSTALTPDTFAAMMQTFIAQILGIDPAQDPEKAYSTVRIGWQKEGQPAWGIEENLCFLTPTLVDDPYSRVRDRQWDPKNTVSITETHSFTQVWKLHLTLYGPLSADRARLIISALSLDWLHDALAVQNVYALTHRPRPAYVPEMFRGQWWKRTDLDLEFNERVLESVAIPSAAGVDVTLLKDTGLSAEIHIRIPQ